MFRQRSPFRCGPSALAFALFVLGDSVFPESFAPEDPGPFSLARLRDIAQSRGIKAHVFRSLPSQLDLSVGSAVLLHLQHDHYVAIFSDSKGTITRFDPADGSMVDINLSDLDESASGYGIFLQLDNPFTRK